MSDQEMKQGGKQCCDFQFWKHQALNMHPSTTPSTRTKHCTQHRNKRCTKQCISFWKCRTVHRILKRQPGPPHRLIYSGVRRRCGACPRNKWLYEDAPKIRKELLPWGGIQHVMGGFRSEKWLKETEFQELLPNWVSNRKTLINFWCSKKQSSESCTSCIA